MGSEYFINNQELENKVRQLLPSQGGAGAGFDLSASTQIIPIIDLTESAEGSNLREDLQSSLSLNSVTAFNVANAAATLVSNTGYYRLFGNLTIRNSGFGNFSLTNGVTTKVIYSVSPTSTNEAGIYSFDFICFLNAGESLTVNSTTGNVIFVGTTRQIATIDGELVDPN